MFLELTRLELQMLLPEGPEEKWRTSADSRDQHSSIQPCLVVSKRPGNSSLRLILSPLFLNTFVLKWNIIPSCPTQSVLIVASLIFWHLQLTTFPEIPP